jgi:hypothetical protein
MIFKKKHKISIKMITLLLAVTFSFNFVFPINLVYAANNAQGVIGDINSAPDLEGSKAGKSSLAKLTDELTGLKQQISGQKLKNDKKAAREAVSSTLNAIKALDVNVETELSSTEHKLKNAGAYKALDRHKSFVEQYQNNIKKLKNDLQSAADLIDVSSEESFSEQEYSSFTQALMNILEEANPTPQVQPLGTELPHRTYGAEPQIPQINGGIIPAYNATVEPDQTGSMCETPTPEDLAETFETRQTESIRDLASQLNHDPVKIFEYVRNNIDFEPYYGSRKGAQETLLEKGGNDFDQASLLISLLRASGYPARYIYGTVEVAEDRAMGWTGTNSASDAVRVFSSAGIPVISVVGGGGISAVRLEHAWVEVCLPYTNYRGIPNGPGEETWVPLDPSFKQYSAINGICLEEIAGINGQELVSQLAANSSIDSQKGTVTEMDFSFLWDQMDAVNTMVNDYLAAIDMQNVSLREVIGGKIIQKEELGLLPASLPYQTNTILNEFAAVPENQQEMIEFSIYGADPFGINFGGSTADFVYKANTTELAGRRITLSWTPATPEDQAVVNQYGQLYQTPAYLVEVKPELRIDGQVVATGQPVGMAYQQKFTMRFISARGEEDRVDNQLTAGAYYAVGLDLQSVSSANLQQRLENINQTSASFTELNIISDEGVGEMLYTTALAYFAQVDAYQNIIGRHTGVTSVRQPSEAITALDLKVGYLFMCPVSVSLGGMHIDVDRDIVSPVSLNGDDEDIRNFMLLSGIMSSSMEHGIFEQLFNFRSISAAKVMTLANAWGIPIYTVTDDNIAQVLPLLQVSSRIKSDIQNAVNAGRTVTIPEQELDYYNWHGTGYIDLDPSSGAAAYMISGYLAGGCTAFTLESAVVILSAFLALSISLPFIIEAFAAGGFISIVFGAADLYFSAEVLHNLTLFFAGDPNAGKEVLNSALFAAGGAAVFKGLSGIWSLVAAKYDRLKYVNNLDVLYNGAATRLLSRGFSYESLMTMRSVNTNIRYLEQAFNETRSFEQFPGFQNWLEKCLRQGELSVVLKNVENKTVARLEGRVTLDLNKLAKAQSEGNISDVEYLMCNVRGCYTESLAKGDAIQSGLLKEIKIDLSHITNSGEDFAYETVNNTMRIIEAKSSVNKVGFQNIEKYLTKELDSQGNIIYSFKVDRFLANVEKYHGTRTRIEFKDAINNGKLEYEFFINSPQGITQELMNLNGLVVDNVKIIMTNVWR